jgi:apolipoprotein N-acyltransferase
MPPSISIRDKRKTALASSAWVLLVVACLTCMVWVAVAQPVLGAAFTVIGVAAATLMGVSISTAAATH